MTEAKYTPGPWTAEARPLGYDKFTHTIKKETLVIGYIAIQSRETEANARLIAASPIILEALRDADDALRGMIYDFEHETGENVDADINHIMEKIKQALANAKADS